MVDAPETMQLREFEDIVKSPLVIGQSNSGHSPACGRPGHLRALEIAADAGLISKSARC